MYSVAYLEQSDKMSEQVRLSMLETVYAPELLRDCAQQSPTRQQKRRRVRHFTALSVLWFVLAMVLWSRSAQGRVWDKLTHWLQDRVAGSPQEPAGASALSYQRELLGVEPGQVYRLATTWLNPRTAPAKELIVLYHERLRDRDRGGRDQNAPPCAAEGVAVSHP